MRPRHLASILERFTLSTGMAIVLFVLERKMSAKLASRRSPSTRSSERAAS